MTYACRYRLLLLLFVGWGAALLGQASDVRFVRGYEAGFPRNSRMSHIWPTDSGYLAFMFKMDTTPAGTYYWAQESVLLDSNFDIQSRKSYGDTTRWYIDWLMIANTAPDGLGNFWYWAYCYQPADSAYFTYYGKFDRHGDTLFERRLPLTGIYDYPRRLVATPLGAVLSEYSSSHPYQRTRLYFMDHGGDISRVDSINPLVGSNHGCAGITTDAARGEVYVPTVDYYFNGYLYNFRPRVFVYDYEGNLLRSKAYLQSLRDHEMGDLYPTADGGFVGMSIKHYVDTTRQLNVSRSAIVKLDADMEVEWTREFGEKRQYNCPTTLNMDSLGNFYMGGIIDTNSTGPSWNNFGYLMKFSPGLDSLWYRMYAEPDSLESTVRWADQVQVLGDRTILYLMNNIPGAGKYSLLYRLDSCGYLVERCAPDTIEPPEPPDTLWPHPDGGIVAYPNPSNGTWAIAWDVWPGDASEISVHDMAGRELLRRMVVRDEKPYVLDLSGCAQGVYFVRIRSERGRMFTGKVLLAR